MKSRTKKTKRLSDAHIKGVDYEERSGICYGKRWYSDLAKAEEFSADVRAAGGTVNGGMLDGMPLGGVYSYRDENGKLHHEVTC